ncbi:Tyrosinase [Penicillium fimorum]|uniref:Tyrosinase n=1 Tax=Penicillium fimorum TaxID=1882269 RepID=A0A9W9XII1_9EURO|nr:Tyrosinase [Penicillium fimorum]
MHTMGCSILCLCVLAILAVLPSAHLSYAQEWNEGQPQKCSKLLTRKEWRTLTNIEKSKWVGAVKVRPPSSP